MLRELRQFLKLESEPVAQILPLTGQVGNRMVVEDFEEGAKRFAQRGIEVAIARQWASNIVAAIEAFGHREALLGELDGIEQRDVGRRTAQANRSEERRVGK